jgi:alkane 1-monooxygenase
LALAAGLTSGLAINTAHELGHKNSRLEKLLAKITLAVPAYGHFTVDHNLGHHRNVSTPADPASARMGESIYKFALREIPGACREAWLLEKDRLARRGKSVWHSNNQILQSYALSALLTLALWFALGWMVLPFIVLHTFFAWWQLTSANYIEHYGLLRQRDAHGRYERCKPHHSWNSNYIYSNLVLLHLERHSDHHTHPTRRYQSLRNYAALPTLPNGYFGVYLLAYLPQLWFRVMDKRLLALPHVDGDLDKVNIDPAARPALFLRYGRDKMNEPTIVI